MIQRVTFYIDGFNFYNGLRAKKKLDSDWQRFYWIDIVKFCKQFISNDQILLKVKYFTATPLNTEKASRQKNFLKANKLINNGQFEVIPGKYKQKPVRCNASCHEIFNIPEEKRTDVNIAVHIVGDCALDYTDKIILISADSDLVPPIEFVKNYYPSKTVSIFFPPERNSSDLNNVCSRKTRKLTNSYQFEIAIMPDLVEVDGVSVEIPGKWRI